MQPDPRPVVLRNKDDSSKGNSSEHVATPLAFTGERMIPGHVDADLYQEHLARYIFAEQLARGKHVLDAACGAGYGSHRLAQLAEKVTGIDSSPDAVAYARANYGANNLAYTVGDVMALPFSDAAFDLVVAFEIIEHLAEPRAFLRELARVLKPDGVAVISTPNRRTYSDARPGYVNPFHAREYYAAEFSSLLQETFPSVRLLCQNYSAVQTFTDVETVEPPGTGLHLACEPGLKASHDEAQFFLAVCGFHQEPVANATHSKPVVLAGTGNILPERERWIKALQQEISAFEATIRHLQAELESRTNWAKQVSEEVAERNGIIRNLQGELDSRTVWATQSAEEVATRGGAMLELQARLERETATARIANEAVTALQATLSDLQKALQERTQSMNRLSDDLAGRDADIQALRKDLETKDATARKAEEETASLDAIIRALRKDLTEQMEREKQMTRQITAAEKIARQMQTLAARERKTNESLREELNQRDKKIQTMQNQIDKIEAMRREAATLREKLHKQTLDMASLSGTVELLIRSGAVSQTPDVQREIQRLHLLGHIRKVAWEQLPANATVLVASDGDDEFLHLGALKAWHFPQNASGDGAESMPADCLAAIAHLEALRARGAEFILFPEPTPHCFAKCPGFQQYLERYYRPLLRDEVCVIFDLCAAARPATPGGFGEFEELIKECEERLARDPSILDWNTNLSLASAFPQCMVFSPSDKEKGLPYADQSVDIVALPSKHSATLAEARRVASAAVVKIVTGKKAAGGFSMEIEWKIDREKAAHPSTSIIIPTYNGVALLRICLRALKETLPRDVQTEIIVADDGSTDDTLKFLREWEKTEPRLKIVRAKRNAGFIATCNLGVKAATGEILVFLNNDTVPLHGWLPPLLRTFRDYPDAGAVGGRLIYPTGRMQEAGGVIFSDSSGANFGRNDPAPGAPLYSFLREVDYCSGALLATPRKLCSELGGFDRHYAPAYYEDTDYCFRIREKGMRVYYQPESSIVHFEGATSGVDISSGAKRYQTINHAKFMKRWKSALKMQPRNPGRYDFGVWHALAVRGASNGGPAK